MNGLGRDIRLGLRALSRSPGFAGVAVLTLALGIGATTAVFSVVRSVLWRPLPYAASERLVRIGHALSSASRPSGTFSPQDFEDLERASAGFQSLAAWQFVPGLTGVNLTGSGEPTRLAAAYVSASFFSTLGTQPLAGRVLVPEENVQGRDAVVVLSRRLWMERFGGDRRIVGRTIRLEGKPFFVAGVMPSDFAFPSAAVDVWVPLSLVGEDAVPHMRGVRWLEAVGRLRPGTSVSATRAAAAALFQRLERQYPDSNAGYGSAVVLTLRESLLGDVRRPLLILLGAVALVLAILCANLAGLLLARGGARQREVAIRAALGATRGRIVRHLLVETAILAAAGGALGALLASWSLALLPAALSSLPRANEIRLDGSALAFTFAISVVTGVAFGLFPAIQAVRRDVVRAIEAGGRSGGVDFTRRRLLRGIVVGECLLAGVLLAGAGLLAKSFWRLSRVETGTRPDNVLTLSVTIPNDRYPTDEKQEAYRAEIVNRLRALPGVRAAGTSKTTPFSGGGEPYGFVVDGRPEPQTRIMPESGAFIVTPGYFAALGIPVLAGRGFEQDDLDRHRPVLVVSDSVARRVWPGDRAVGKVVRMGPKMKFEVIGIAGDVRQDGVELPARGAMYVPASLFPRSTFKVFLRFTGDPSGLGSAARAAIWSVDKDQPISDIRMLPQILASSIARPRFFMLLLVGFGAAALALAAIGLYGTLSYGIRQRRREIGIRMALGADARDVLALILREGTGLAALGITLSIPAALVLSRLLEGLLFDVRPADPIVLALVALFLMSVAILASWLPALSAARIEPSVALRRD
jgi:putative ABC transport system permease protein